MNAIIVDTSVWIEFFAGNLHPEVDQGLKDGRVYLTPLIVAELYSGRLTSRQKKQLTAFVDCLPLAPTPIEHWQRTGQLRADLAKKGFQVSTPDAHIAQCCLDLNCFLTTEGKIFLKISKLCGLKLVR